jgi:hypothetical protein
MKRKLLFAGAFIILAWAGSSCEALRTCEVCKKVYYDGNGAVTSQDAEASYCDAELIAIKATGTIDLGQLGTAKWDCR